MLAVGLAPSCCSVVAVVLFLASEKYSYSAWSVGMIRYRVPIALVCWLFNPRGWHGYGLRFCRFMAQSSGGNISVFNILKSEKLRDTYNLYHCSGVRGKGVDGISPIVSVPPPSFFSMGIKSVGQKDGISWAKRWQKLAKNVYN
jgi:hypothetical protein